jgi:hypothetical protein
VRTGRGRVSVTEVSFTLTTSLGDVVTGGGFRGMEMPISLFIMIGGEACMAPDEGRPPIELRLLGAGATAGSRSVMSSTLYLELFKVG